ncbi:MAG: hypothetical protein HQK77_18310 [Desulfobacterales bacterium]|nr:hypothetical protein [Desulfobacterales bacterium]
MIIDGIEAEYVRLILQNRAHCMMLHYRMRMLMLIQFCKSVYHGKHPRLIEDLLNSFGYEDSE